MICKWSLCLDISLVYSRLDWFPMPNINVYINWVLPWSKWSWLLDRLWKDISIDSKAGNLWICCPTLVGISSTVFLVVTTRAKVFDVTTKGRITENRSIYFLICLPLCGAYPIMRVNSASYVLWKCTFTTYN